MYSSTYTAFAAELRLVTGDLPSMLKAIKAFANSHRESPVLVFEDDTGQQVDFDLRGTDEEVLARVEPAKPKLGPGRPALGVVCREVSLLPRHWEWLERQQHNASATIRRLVEEAIKNEPAAAKARRFVEATDRVMWVLAGNLPGCEEASRALYAGDTARFESIVEKWPPDVVGYLLNLAAKGKA
jgi:hypothetical protein